MLNPALEFGQHDLLDLQTSALGTLVSSGLTNHMLHSSLVNTCMSMLCKGKCKVYTVYSVHSVKCKQCTVYTYRKLTYVVPLHVEFLHDDAVG